MSSLKRMALLLALASGFCLAGEAQTNLTVPVQAAGFTMAAPNLICDCASCPVPFWNHAR